MLKTYQIFYSDDFYTRGCWRQASGSAQGLSESTWNSRKNTWKETFDNGEVSELLFLVTQVDTETGIVTILENTYGCAPLKTKRVINVQAKQETVSVEESMFDGEETGVEQDD